MTQTIEDCDFYDEASFQDLIRLATVNFSVINLVLKTISQRMILSISITLDLLRNDMLTFKEQIMEDSQ